MSEKINKQYTPQQLSQAIFALIDAKLSEEDAVTLIKKLHELGYRLVKCPH